jgi:hypothetical protein
VWVAAALVLAASATAAAAKRQQIDSHWLDRPVKVDGDNGDWAGPLAPIDEKLPLNAAVENDGQSLYLVLTTSDQSTRREIMRQGLIVWFDPSGGEKKHFGIKFPVGFGSENGARGGRGRWGGSGHSSGADPGDQNPAPEQRSVVEPPDRLEVYGPAKDDAHSFVVEAAPGIAVKVGQVEGYLVYELKVPLVKDSERPYAIEAKPGSAIGFGLETPKVEAAEHRGGFGGMSGGMGGRGGGMGGAGGMGGPGGGGHRGGFEEAKPLKAWATIQLAAH